MLRYSVQPREWTCTKGYEFLSSAKSIGKILVKI